MSKLSAFLGILKLVAPIVLSQTKLAPIADEVAAGIAIAEELPGASGAEKLQKATDLAKLAAQAANDQKGSPIVSEADIVGTINGVVGVVNHVKAIKVDQPVQPAA